MGKDSNIQLYAVYFRKTNPPRKDWERDYQSPQKTGIR
jgi:hypothetical protein